MRLPPWETGSTRHDLTLTTCLDVLGERTSSRAVPGRQFGLTLPDGEEKALIAFRQRCEWASLFWMTNSVWMVGERFALESSDEGSGQSAL